MVVIKKAYDTASLKLNEVDTYLELGRQLQRAYGTHIVFLSVLKSIIFQALNQTFKSS